MCVCGGQSLNANPTESSTLDSTSSTQNSGVYDLGRVEITSKSDSPDYNPTVQTINAKDISNNGANDITAALRHTPGVFYQGIHNSGIQRAESSISLRGFSGSYVGFFIDGIPVSATYGRTDWGQFSAFGISEISVSKGYTSPVYGMNTLGGAVNMVTQKPTRELEITAKYNFVSNNENRYAISIGQNFGKVYYQLSYAFTDRDSYNLSHNFTPTDYQARGERRNSYYKNHTIRAKVGFEPNENHEYSLNLIYQKGQKGGMLNTQQASNFWKWPNYDKLTAYIIGNSKFSDKLSLNSRIYYDSFYNKLRMMGLSLPYAQGDVNTNAGYRGNSTYDDYTIGGIFTLGYDFDVDKKLKVGLNLKHNKHQSKDRDSAGVSATKDEGLLKEISTSVFTEYAQALNDTLRFALSASYDRNDMIKTYVWENRGSSGNNANYVLYDKNLHLQGWSLQGVLYTQLNDYTTMHLNIGKKLRLPDLGSRYSQSMGGRVRNPNLDPESIINYEIGSNFEYEATKAFVALYYQDINNIHIDVPTTGCYNSTATSCVQARNGKEGFSYGGEIGFSQGILDVLNISANYSYVQRQVTNKSLTSYATGARILNYPNHIANANITLTPMKQLDFIATASYQSAMWVANSGTYSRNNDVFLLDIRLNYRPINALEFSLGLYNALDRNYYYGVGNYMPGRRILAGVEYRF